MPKKQKVPRSVAKSLKEQAVRGKIRQPDLAKLVGHFFEVAGGERQVAKMLFAEYQDSPAGGITRQRILDMILRATKFANEQDPPQEDLGMLTEADLEQELASMIEEIADDEAALDDTRPAGGAPQEDAGEEAARAGAGPAAAGGLLPAPDAAAGD